MPQASQSLLQLSLQVLGCSVPLLNHRSSKEKGVRIDFCGRCGVHLYMCFLCKWKQSNIKHKLLYQSGNPFDIASDQGLSAHSTDKSWGSDIRPLSPELDANWTRYFSPYGTSMGIFSYLKCGCGTTYLRENKTFLRSSILVGKVQGILSYRICWAWSSKVHFSVSRLICELLLLPRH